MDMFIQYILSIASIGFIAIVIVGIIKQVLNSNVIIDIELWTNYFAYVMITWITYILSLNLSKRMDNKTNNISLLFIKIYPYLNFIISIAIISLYFVTTKSAVYKMSSWFIQTGCLLNLILSIYLIRSKTNFEKNWVYILILFLVIVISPLGPYKTSERSAIKVLEDAKNKKDLFQEENIRYTQIYEKENRVVLENLAYLNTISPKAKNYATKYTLEQLNSNILGDSDLNQTFINFYNNENLELDISRYSNLYRLRGSNDSIDNNRIQIDNEKLIIILENIEIEKIEFEMIRKALEDSTGKSIDFYTTNNNRLVFESLYYQGENDYNLDGFYFYTEDIDG